jgi:hypothetical protein
VSGVTDQSSNQVPDTLKTLKRFYDDLLQNHIHLLEQQMELSINQSQLDEQHETVLET